MKQSLLLNPCSHSRLFSFIFVLVSFSIFFVTTTHAQVAHRRLWQWPPRPWPGWFRPWPMYPPKPGPKPSPPPGRPPCGPPKPPPRPGPSCPPIPPKPQPKPPPPRPSPSCPPKPPKPQPKPPPPPRRAPPPPPRRAPPPPPKPKPKPPPPPPRRAPPPPPKPKPKPAPPPPKPRPAPPPPKPQNRTIPAVFFFGDSVFDTGNNNERKTKVKSNYRPYGMDFPNGVATGRFSNGKVASDFIAKYLGVKETVPPFIVDPKGKKLQQSNIQKSDLLTGVSFASGGTGWDPETSKAVKVPTMLEQLNNFQDYQEKLKRSVGIKKTKEIIGKGAAIVGAGGNDLVFTYYGSKKKRRDTDKYITFMADSAASFVLQLYGYGARRIGVVGTPPIGCTPSQLVKKKKKKRCNEDLNYASQLFNSKLLIILGQLSKTLPNSTLVYMDIYSIFAQMLESPRDYGFEEIQKPCCKISGLFGGGIFCKKKTRKICSNTSSYLFWDGAHPTQNAYRTINKILIKKYLRFI